MRLTRPAPTRNRSRKDLLLCAIASLTCPCHIPVAAILLSGTAVGGAIAARQMWLIAGSALIYVVVVVMLFGRPRWFARCAGAACQVGKSRAPRRPRQHTADMTTESTG